jgi:hypothetical protein
MILGRDIKRYSLDWSGTWVNYDEKLKDKLTIKDIKSKKGMTPQKRVDFALRNPEIYNPKKIIVRKTADKIICSYDDYGYYFDSLSYGIQLKIGLGVSIIYILGILNSRLINYLHEKISKNKDKVFAKVLATNLKKLPIPKINLTNSPDKKLHDRMVEIVDHRLEIQKKYHSAKLETEKKMFKTQIDALDKQIDQLVYELYDLTPEEIAIVEGEK